MTGDTAVGSQVALKANQATTNTAANEPTSGPCYLLGLPAELRNYIYEFAVSEWMETEVETYRKNFDYPPPELTQVCRQIRNEVHAVLYQHKCICFASSGYHTLTEELNFGLLEHYIPKLRRIEIANRFHSSHFTLSIDSEDPLKWGLEIVAVPNCEICGPNTSEKCFANSISLAVGRKYLGYLAKRAGGGGLLDARTLENLISSSSSTRRSARATSTIHSAGVLRSTRHEIAVDRSQHVNNFLIFGTATAAMCML